MIQKHSKYLITLLLLAICSLKGLSQNNDQYEFFSHTIKYNDSYSSYYNDIFNQIAQSTSRNKFVPYFQYNLSLKYNIQAIDKDKYRLSIALTDISTTGDTKLNRFDLTKYIKPQKIEGILYLMGSSSQIYTKINLSINSTQSFPIQITDTIITLRKPLSEIKLKFDNFKYYIYQGGYTEFANYFKIISEYNKSKTKIEDAIKTIKTINLLDIDMVQVNDIKLDGVEVYFNTIEQMNLTERLNLKNSDPEDFINNFTQLRLQIDYFRKNINSLLANLDNYYYEDAMKFAQYGDTSKAIEYFNKSINLNILNIKSQIELTNIELKNNKTDESSKRLIEFFKAYTPYGTEGQKTLNTLKEVNNIYLDKGIELTHQKMFNEAIDVLEKCYNLCNNIPVFPCSEKLFNAMQNAKMGLYHSYVSVVEKAIQQKLWNMADTYIQQAKKYQESNITYIPDHNKTDELLAKVYNRYIISAEKNSKSGYYTTAIEFYTKALAICEKHNIKCNDNVYNGIKNCKYGIYNEFIKKAITALSDSAIQQTEDYITKAKQYQSENIEITSFRTADSLLGKMKDVFYQQYIAYGKKMLSEYNLNEAFNSFIKAKDIESNYLVTASIELPQLLQNTTKQYIVSKKEDLDYLIWANKLDSAYKIIDNYNYYISKSNCINDSSLLSYVKDTKTKIANKYCHNLSLEFERCTSLANTNISSLNFITAIDYLNKALNTSKLSKNCALDTINTHNKVVEILPASQYQSMINESKNLLDNSKYIFSLNKYKEAEELYTNKELSRLGLIHKPLQEFVAQSKNAIFIDSAMAYSFKSKEYIQNINILSFAKSNKTKINKSISFEIKTSKELAKLDFKKNPRITSKEALLNYVGFANLKVFNFYYKINLFKLKTGLLKL